MELVQSANLEDKASVRIEQIDIMRGFALLGIGLENIFSMHTTNALFAEYSARYPHGINHFLLLGLMILVRGKFYPIFSFVFGASAALGFPDQGSRFFLRRLGGLFLLGVVQVMFIWEGDVLVQYAFFGLLLLLLRNWSPILLLFLGLGLLLFSFVSKLWGLPESMVAVQNVELYKTGAFLELVAFRVQEYTQSIFTWEVLLFYSRIFAFMLLGFAFVKSRKMLILTSPVRHRNIFLGHLGLVLIIAAVVQVAGWRGASGDSSWLKEVSMTIYFYAAVVCLALLPVLLWSLPQLHRFLSLLQWMGRLTLTHYLVQNLLFSLLFYGYGLGLFLELEPWQCILLYLAVISVQLYLSSWLLKRYKLGPVEYILRRIAGKKQKGAS